MNNDKIISEVLKKVIDDNWKFASYSDKTEKAIREAISLTLQEAQKQKDDEIENYKTALKLLTEDYEELEQQLSDVNKIIDDAKIKFIEKIKHCGNLTSKYDYENECYVKDDSNAIIVLEYFTEIFNEELKSSLSKGDVHTQQDKTRKKVATSETEDKLSVKKEDKTAEPLDAGLFCPNNSTSAPKDEDRRNK